MHGVVVALLKSGYVAEVNLDSACRGRMAGEGVRAGKLTLQLSKYRKRQKQMQSTLKYLSSISLLA